jgi:14-3-3 protein epsilon
MSEVSESDARQRYSNLSYEAYKLASDISMADLPSTHPIRLGLALNYSVYYY